MDRSEYAQILSTVTMLAETARRFRDVKEVVELGADTLKRFWFLVPVAAAGWTFMVTDDDRRAVLEGLADQVLSAFPQLAGS